MPDFRQKRGSHIFLGVVHLPPLPGAPGYDGDWRGLLHRAAQDADALLEGGVDGLIVENFGDAPFYPRQVPPETCAAMTAAASHLRRISSTLAIGVNVLRNDAETALAAAVAAECDFVRVNVLHSVRVTDQGLVSGRAHAIARLRCQLQATNIGILADVDVKHSAPLAGRPLEEETRELLERAGADAVIVSGSRTGSQPRGEDLRRIRGAAADEIVLVGSGARPEILGELLPNCDGFIVGTWLKKDGRVENPVDPQRVREFARALA